MRLIDADALEEFLLNDSSCLTVFEAIRKTQLMPTIDAVPVVRCEDCIFWHKPLQCPMDTSEAWTSFDEYCSRGQRRKDGDA